MRSKLKNRLKRMGFCVCLVFFLSCFCGLVPDAYAQAKTNLKLADGSMGSYWYSYATVVTELIRKNVPNVDIIITPGGGASNIPAVNMGKVQLALSLSQTAYQGIMGTSPFKEKSKKIKEVVALAGNPYYIVVWADSGIETIDDFKGKRLNVTPRGYTSEVMTRDVLRAYGMSYADLKKVEYASNADAILLMKDNHLDGMVYYAGRQASYVFELGAARPVSLVSVDKAKASQLTTENPGLKFVTIDKKTFNMQQDTLALECWLHLIASEDLPQDLIYNITKVLVENIKTLQEFSKGTEDLSSEQMAMDVGIPFHPGALKYFKEKGLK